MNEQWEFRLPATHLLPSVLASEQHTSASISHQPRVVFKICIPHIEGKAMHSPMPLFMFATSFSESSGAVHP